MNEAALASRVLRRRAAAGCGLFAAVALAWIAAWAAAEPWSVAREHAYQRGTGWAALSFLLASLCVTPLDVISTHLRGGKGLAAARVARRALGMTAAWLGLLHAACMVSGPLGDSLGDSLGAMLYSSQLLAGLTTLGVLCALLLTSFGRVVRALRLQTWRELHRLSYVAAALALQHVLLSPFAPRTRTLALFGAVLLLSLLRLRRPGLMRKGGVAHRA